MLLPVDGSAPGGQQGIPGETMPMPMGAAPGMLPVDSGGGIGFEEQGVFPGMGFDAQMAPQRPPELDILEQLADAKNAASVKGEDGELLISDEVLGELARQVEDGYKRDKASRCDWEDDALKAMEMAKQKREGKSYPFPNAANVQYPLITIAAQQFNARAYPAICTGNNVVRVRIGGADKDGAKAARGNRIQEFMSHQIVDGMQGAWEHDMDVLLYQMPILGSAFKKSYWDFDAGGVQLRMISAFDFVVHSDTRDLRCCPRMSHRFSLYPYEVEERQRSGTYLDVETDGLSAVGAGNDEQEPIWFIEQHCYFDLDGDGYAEPWIVTQTEDDGVLVRITAGFDPLEVIHDGEKIVRIPREEYFTAFYFLPDPEGGFYGIGFGHLLRSFGEVIDTSFNQMLDSGNLQNAGGGFIGEGLDFQSEAEEFRFEPGKYYTVTAEGGDIRNSIYTLQHPGPSPVLFQLLGMMLEAAKQITSVQDILTGQVGAQTMQPTTLMALIDQGMKVFTAIYKRIYESLGQEFRILYRLNRKYLDDQEYADYIGEPLAVEPMAPMAPQGMGMPSQMPMPPQMPTVEADFADDGCLVMPVSDPSSVTMAQRMARSSFLLQLLTHPVLGGMLDPAVILQRVLASGEIDNIPEVLAKPAPPSPVEQIGQAQALADIKLTEAQALHNMALVEREAAQSEHARAQTASEIMGHMPDYFVNPPVRAPKAPAKAAK